MKGLFLFPQKKGGGAIMTVRETANYIEKKKTEDLASNESLTAYDSMLKIIGERYVLQRRCYGLTNGDLCSMCRMECELREREL